MSQRDLLVLLLLGLSACAGPNPAPEAAVPKANQVVRAELHSDDLEPLLVHVINVGQGDAILVQCPHRTHEFLIDAGELNQRYSRSQTLFKSYMTSHLEVGEELEVALATHPHSDHIGGMSWVFASYAVKHYIDNGMVHESKTYTSVNEAVGAEVGCTYTDASVSSSTLFSVDFCPLLKAVVLRPGDLEDLAKKNPNNGSLLVRLDYGTTSFLFTGDCENDEEAVLLSDESLRAALDADLLKLSHHGAENGSGAEFLAAVTPIIAAISTGKATVGTNKGHKHPRFAATSRVAELVAEDPDSLGFRAYDAAAGDWKEVGAGRAIYCTKGVTDLVFESDGTTISLQ